MRAGRIVVVVIGALLSLLGFCALAGGVALVVLHGTQRDDAGYYMSSARDVETSTAVLVTSVDLTGPPGANRVVPAHPIGTVRLAATPQQGAGPIFIGIGPQDKVDSWLAGSAYDRVTDVRLGPSEPVTEFVSGDRAVTPPAGQTFWVASATGTGTQTVTWRSEPGRWAVVLANADASTGVTADVSAGVRTGVLLPIGLLAGFFGLLLLAGGVTVMVAAVRGAGTPTSAAVPAVAGKPGSYPVRLDARLDPRLSRWLWLVKWILVLPHAIVLALLWLAVIPLTVVAGVAILFTGRYPRSIFDFNVGVMRWSWRVTYYAYSALGTDRYPPFSLHSDPDYPADFTVDYPERLSRGLVLVKWWLLAIPHYLVVGVFAGGWAGWVAVDDGSGATLRLAGTGLIALLVFVAAVILLFTGRYPVPLYDFVLGMNRWCYRVLAYAALMRDEYPPFRLDSGGSDPGSVPVPPPTPRPDRAGDLVGTGPGATAG
jgi:hypothetical protein